MTTFSQQVTQLARSHSWLCTGIDPHPEAMPHYLRDRLNSGCRRDDVTQVLVEYGCALIEASLGHVCAIKLQAACFESFGISGWTSLSEIMSIARSRGLPIILDAKRGDIAQSARAYANAYLENHGSKSEFLADALTINPWLGVDSLEPFFDAATRSGKTVFVLTRTSNPGASWLQDALLSQDSPPFQTASNAVAALIESRNRVARSSSPEIWGTASFGPAGAVIGSTQASDAARLRAVAPSALILAPGYGAQGGTGEALHALANHSAEGCIVPVSRGLLTGTTPATTKKEFIKIITNNVKKNSEDILISLKKN